MIRILSLFLLLFAVVGLYLAFIGIEPEPDRQIINAESEEWVMDEFLARYIEDFEQDFEEGLNREGIPGAAVAIVKEGRVVFQKGFGVKEKGKPDKVDEHTVFRLASVSKGFASVLTECLWKKD